MSEGFPAALPTPAATVRRAAPAAAPTAAPTAALTAALTATSVAASAAVLVTASGCVGLATPERPPYTGLDRVGEVAPERLVGVWNVTPLNPYPEQPPQTTVIEYRADGSVLGRVVPDRESAMGDLAFETRGRWKVVDGVVVHENVTMTASSDNPLAKLMSEMVNGRRDALGGEADILELDAERIVMLGSDGAAMEYVRR